MFVLTACCHRGRCISSASLLVPSAMLGIGDAERLQSIFSLLTCIAAETRNHSKHLLTYLCMQQDAFAERHIYVTRYAYTFEAHSRMYWARDPYVFEATSWPFANAFLFDFMLQSCWFFLCSWKQCWDKIVLFRTAKLVSCNHNVNTKRSWRKWN